MSLDQRAAEAARELLDGSAPDAAGRLSQLPRLRRRRAGERLVTGAAVLLVALGVIYGARMGLADRSVEPAGPTVGNGALVSLSLDGRHVVVADGDVAHLPADAQPFTRLHFTADGRELVYVARGRAVIALNVTTGSTRTLATCPDSCQPALSPDGRTVAYEDMDRPVLPSDGAPDLVLQDVGGGPAVPLGVRGWAPTWSPNGERLAYLDRQGLMVVDADGSDPRRLATYDMFEISAPDWSPDGRRLVFVLTEKTGRGSGSNLPMLDHTLATVGLDGAPPDRLADLGNCICLGVSAPTATWSPDGRLLAYTRLNVNRRDPGATTADGVYAMRPDGTGEERLTSGVESELAWQPLRGE